MNPVEERRGCVVIDFPKSADDVARARCKEGSRDTWHALHMRRVTTHCSASREDHQWCVAEVQCGNVSCVQVSRTTRAVCDQMQRSKGVRRIAIGVSGIMNKAASLC